MNLKNTLTILTVLMSTSYAQDRHPEMPMNQNHNQQETYRFEGNIVGKRNFDDQQAMALKITKSPRRDEIGKFARVPDELFTSDEDKVVGTRVFFNEVGMLMGNRKVFLSLPKNLNVKFEKPTNINAID